MDEKSIPCVSRKGIRLKINGKESTRDDAIGTNQIVLLHRHREALDEHHAPIVLRPQCCDLPCRQGLPQQQRRQQGPLIAWRVGRIQQGVEVMAQFFGEHSEHRHLVGPLQPVGVEIDGAGADPIGAKRPRHRLAGEQLHRR